MPRAAPAAHVNTLSQPTAQPSRPRLLSFSLRRRPTPSTLRSRSHSFSLTQFIAITQKLTVVCSPVKPTSLADLATVLTPLEKQFFEMLDRELEKVDGFYREREAEAVSRLVLLKEQLRELRDHQRLFQVRPPFSRNS